MAETNLFKWRHYESEIILLCVRCYLRYAPSYRDLEEMMNERGLSVDHKTIYRWVQWYAPELEKRSRPHLRPPNDSYRVDETYVKVKGKWYYLYRAVDSTGQTIDFMFSAKRDARAAKRFFRKMLKLPQHSSPRVINVDQNSVISNTEAPEAFEIEPDTLKQMRNVCDPIIAPLKDFDFVVEALPKLARLAVEKIRLLGSCYSGVRS